MNTQYLSDSLFEKKLREPKTGPFTVRFIKLNGDFQERTARLDVKIEVKGTGRKLPSDRFLYFDTTKNAPSAPYRKNVVQFQHNNTLYIRANNLNARTATVSSLDVDLSI